ncbi:MULTISPECIES: TIGR03084 family metal-binding protein [Thermomonosporaceae]|uniref:TIGR03084 family metal-binding protein n=1 Tax=Thermomonosporaceae TaxID=2012 RepID=UPI00255B2FD7|nr:MULTISPECIES: TIGR03084 family metal-binding protein [Thermomonosporaceae]MDL4772770.1 TIGR03084 family metal-binding protein [Actinomadura xylanilytica]
MPDLNSLLADLTAEGESLDALVAPLPAVRWAAPTPAEGWTIAHQIAHLAWTDRQSTVAATDSAAFAGILAGALEPGYVDRGAAEGAAEEPARLLDRWRSGRARIAGALAAVPAGTRLPWFGPPMSAASMATARLMETWAHGQDIADTLDVHREPTHRLRHVAHIGVRARDFAFHNRGLTPPTAEFRVALTAPSGDAWTWGPPDAEQSVTAPALDFCLLVTRRRHPGDLSVTATGPDAARWLEVAQAFAGPPGTGRAAMRA